MKLEAFWWNHAGISREFSKEHTHRQYESNIKFTPNQVSEALIKKNPDAITAVRIGDNDGDDLWEIWAHVLSVGIPRSTQGSMEIISNPRIRLFPIPIQKLLSKL